MALCHSGTKSTLKGNKGKRQHENEINDTMKTRFEAQAR
jgi:hypothetical protein